MTAARSTDAAALALELAVVLARSEIHPGGGHFGGDGYERLEWLTRNLKPLARHSVGVRRALAILDLDDPADTYDDPRSYLRQLRLLEQRAQRFAPRRRR